MDVLLVFEADHKWMHFNKTTIDQIFTDLVIDDGVRDDLRLNAYELFTSPGLYHPLSPSHFLEGSVERIILLP